MGKTVDLQRKENPNKESHPKWIKGLLSLTGFPLTLLLCFILSVLGPHRFIRKYYFPEENLEMRMEWSLGSSQPAKIWMAYGKDRLNSNFVIVRPDGGNGALLEFLIAYKKDEKPIFYFLTEESKILEVHMSEFKLERISNGPYGVELATDSLKKKGYKVCSFSIDTYPVMGRL